MDRARCAAPPGRVSLRGQWSELLLIWRVVVSWTVILCCCSPAVSTGQVMERTLTGSSAVSDTSDGSEASPGRLSCYSCHSSLSGADVCANGTLLQNQTRWQTQCLSSHNYCMVRIYKTSTSVNGSRAQSRVWSVERACAAECDHSCLVIGERTKIISYVSCCTDDLCNYDDGAATYQKVLQPVVWLCAAVALAVR